MSLAFRFDNFSQQISDDVTYGFYGRQGGVSEGIYSSLNCSFGSDDEDENASQNRALIAEDLSLQDDGLLSLYQYHSAECVTVAKPWEFDDRPRADAFVTNLPGIGLGILTADCAPVLFFAKGDNGSVIGATHAGWRGALGGVLEATVNAMTVYEGVTLENISACVGPCIAKSSYEVSVDFADTFLKQDDTYEFFFSAGQTTDKMQFDLPGFCAQRLSQAGLKNITISGLDTYKNEDDFFSYRRATHRSEPDYARQLSVIAIKP